MADFDTKLRWLSERGNPVGAEELIERIEADLAGDPPVIVAKRREGTTMTTQQPPKTKRPSRYRGPATAVAAFAAVLAVVALFLTFSGDDDQVADTTPTTMAPDVETMTDLEIIQAGVSALYSGDAELAAELFERSELRGEDLGGSYDLIGDDGWIRRQAAYQAAIGGRLTLDCTKGITPGEFTCNMLYHNALTDAVGGVDASDSPGGESVPVTVQDGVITEFYVPVIEFLLDEAGGFLGERLIDGYEDCTEEDGSRLLRTPECANLFMVHFDEWVAWCGRIVTDPDEVFASRCERE